MSYFGKLGKVSLECVDHRTADEPRRPQRGLEYGEQFGLQFLMGRQQVQEGNLRVGVHRATSTSSAVDRNRRAAFPATMALAGTFRVTTLPAPIRAFSPIVIFA